MDGVSEQYSKIGTQNNWQRAEAGRNPQLENRYAELLFKEGMIPTKSEAEGFVFFSPSANQGLYEYTIAEKLNEFLSHSDIRFTKRPMFIAADFFGALDEKGVFVTGFSSKDKKNFSNVSFHQLSADARKIPLAEHAVDIVWDRLGALWHTQFRRFSEDEPNSETILKLLDEYRRILKPNGVVIVDADLKSKGAPNSTIDLLEGKCEYYEEWLSEEREKYKIDLQGLGWDIHFIGHGDSRLAVLKPLEKITD